MVNERKHKRQSKIVKTKEDYEAFKSAAGDWKDVDTDRLLADIYADRRASNRLPIRIRR
jgi:hypothetical protein